MLVKVCSLCSTSYPKDRQSLLLPSPTFLIFYLIQSIISSHILISPCNLIFVSHSPYFYSTTSFFVFLVTDPFSHPSFLLFKKINQQMDESPSFPRILFHPPSLRTRSSSVPPSLSSPPSPSPSLRAATSHSASRATSPLRLSSPSLPARPSTSPSPLHTSPSPSLWHSLGPKHGNLAHTPQVSRGGERRG